jgi:hypothetical protein
LKSPGFGRGFFYLGFLFVSANVKNIAFNVGQCCNVPIRFAASRPQLVGPECHNPVNFGVERFLIAAKVNMHTYFRRTFYSRLRKRQVLNPLDTENPGVTRRSQDYPSVVILGLDNFQA